MRTYPSSEDVQGATYYYYPGLWNGYNFKTALTVHNFHSQGSIPCRAAYRGIQANTYTTYPSHPTGYPFIHLGEEQQCG